MCPDWKCVEFGCVFFGYDSQEKSNVCRFYTTFDGRYGGYQPVNGEDCPNFISLATIRQIVKKRKNPLKKIKFL